MQSYIGQDITGELHPRLFSDPYTHMHTHLEKHVHCPVTRNTQMKCHKQRTTGDTGCLPVYINLLIFLLCTAYMIQGEKLIVESYFHRNGVYMCPVTSTSQTGREHFKKWKLKRGRECHIRKSATWHIIPSSYILNITIGQTIS